MLLEPQLTAYAVKLNRDNHFTGINNLSSKCSSTIVENDTESQAIPNCRNAHTTPRKRENLGHSPNKKQ